MAPSPTADATRLTDAARTSPAAKTPGTLVSRWYGSRGSRQPAGRCPLVMRSVPVTTNPRSSRVTAPSSQSVWGSAPMKTNSHDVETSLLSPERLSRRVRLCRCPSPSAQVTSVHGWISMPGMPSSWSMR